jgi:hypothetical protein
METDWCQMGDEGDAPGRIEYSVLRKPHAELASGLRVITRRQRLMPEL